MPETVLNRYTYPREDEDPFFESIVATFNQVDVGIYQAKNLIQSFLCGGGTVAWNSGTQVLTWTDDFKIPIVMSGFVLNLKYGPDNANRSVLLQNGEFMYVQVPTMLTANVTKNMSKGTQLSYIDGLFVVAYNCQNILYLRNGSILT